MEHLEKRYLNTTLCIGSMNWTQQNQCTLADLNTTLCIGSIETKIAKKVEQVSFKYNTLYRFNYRIKFKG